MLGMTLVFKTFDLIRHDATRDKVSSVSPDTKRLIRELETKHPVFIDAFVSEQIPESYVETKIDLIAKLKEIEALAGSKINVRYNNNLVSFSEEAGPG